MPQMSSTKIIPQVSNKIIHLVSNKVLPEVSSKFRPVKCILQELLGNRDVNIIYLGASHLLSKESSV